MPNSWMHALNAYSYPVDLTTYEKAIEFPGFFNQTIKGDRNSTIDFENCFQKNAPYHISSFFEVIYWKYYSQAQYRKKGTDRIIAYVQENRITSIQLWEAIQEFVNMQTIKNLRNIRNMLGLTTRVLAVALTLPALASPETLPMVDTQVAKWINNNIAPHNDNRHNKLTTFNLNYTSLQDNDFSNYINWIAWCKEVSHILTEHTDCKWRVRDVEMAVFTAQRQKLSLNVLS